MREDERLYMSTEEVRIRFRLKTQKTVRRWYYDGILPGFRRPDGSLLFRRKDVEAFEVKLMEDTKAKEAQ